MQLNPNDCFKSVDEATNQVNMAFGNVFHEIAQMDIFKQFPMETLWWYTEKLFTDPVTAQRHHELMVGDILVLTRPWVADLRKRINKRYDELKRVPASRIMQDFHEAPLAPLHLYVAQVLFQEEVFNLQAKYGRVEASLDDDEYQASLAAAEAVMIEEAGKILAPLNMGIEHLVEVMTNIEPLFTGMRKCDYAHPLPPSHPKNASLSFAYANTLAAYRLLHDHFSQQPKPKSVEDSTMNNKDIVSKKVEEAIKQLMAGDIVWEQLEEIVEEATKDCGPRPQMSVQITYGGETSSSTVEISKGFDV